MRERLAVTGVGLVSSLGGDVESTFRALCAGERGFGPVTAFDVTGHRCSLAAEVKLALCEDEPELARTERLAWAAARQALAQADLPEGCRLGVVVGTTTGQMLEAEFALLGEGGDEAGGDQLVRHPLQSTADRLAARVTSIVARETLCSACSSGAAAITLGAAWLRAGRVDAVLVGGADALCRMTFTGFGALGALSTSDCRPFDATRSGLLLGEGAGFLVLERESQLASRRRAVRGWLLGEALGAEAHHLTHPEPSGEPSARLIERALELAGQPASAVDYVNLHGTGTQANDAMETLAMHRVFGSAASAPFVSSSKGQLGHTLGAAGAIEAIITLEALRSGQLPPTGGLTTIAEDGQLRHILGVAQPAAARVALSTSFGFGGAGAVLVFGREDADAPATVASPLPSPSTALPAVTAALVVTAAVAVTTTGRHQDAALAKLLASTRAHPDADASSVQVDPLSLLDPERSRRFDRFTAYVAAGIDALLSESGLAGPGVGLCLSSAYGNVARTVDFLSRAAKRGPRMANPAEFPHLVPSAGAANGSLYGLLTGPVVNVFDATLGGHAALAVGLELLIAEQASAVIVGASEACDSHLVRCIDDLSAWPSSPSDRVGEGTALLLLEPAAAAAARGQAVLAHCLWQGLARSGASLGELPAPVGDCCSLAAGPGFEPLPGELGSWSAVPQVTLNASVGWQAGRGAFALAAAVGLLQLGPTQRVLVWDRRDGWLRAAVFAAPGCPSPSVDE